LIFLFKWRVLFGVCLLMLNENKLSKKDAIELILNDTQNEKQLFDQAHTAIQSITKNLYLAIAWEFAGFYTIWSWNLLTSDIRIKFVLSMFLFLFLWRVYKVYTDEIKFYLKLRWKIHFYVMNNYKAIWEILKAKWNYEKIMLKMGRIQVNTNNDDIIISNLKKCLLFVIKTLFKNIKISFISEYDIESYVQKHSLYRFVNLLNVIHNPIFVLYSKLIWKWKN